MSADDLMLAELLCARLCHDLAGPVGAVAAGAELLEDGIADPETLALVAASASGAAARLKFLRAAFGPGGQPQPAQVLRDLIATHLGSSSSAAAPAPTLDWRLSENSLPADSARLLLNLALLARDALPKGGAVVIEASAPTAMTVTATGPSAGLAEDVRAVLVDGATPQGPRGGQALLARRLAETVAGRLAATLADGAVKLQAVPIAHVNSHSDGQGSF